MAGNRSWPLVTISYKLNKNDLIVKAPMLSTMALLFILFMDPIVLIVTLNQFDLIVKAANASDNGIALHPLHGFHSDDLEAAGCSNKDVNLADNLHRRPNASMMML